MLLAAFEPFNSEPDLGRAESKSMHQRTSCPNLVFGDATIGLCKMSHRLEQGFDEVLRQTVQTSVKFMPAKVTKSLSESSVELMPEHEAEKRC